MREEDESLNIFVPRAFRTMALLNDNLLHGTVWHCDHRTDNFCTCSNEEHPLFFHPALSHDLVLLG